MMRRSLGYLLVSSLVGTGWASANIFLLVGLHHDLDWTAVALLTLYIWSCIALWWTVISPRVLPVSLMFWFYVSSFSLLPGYAQVVHQEFFWSPFTGYETHTLLTSCAIFLAGLLGMTIGFRVADSSIYRLRSQYPVALCPQVLTPSLKLIIISFILLLGIVAWILYLGVGSFVRARAEGVAVDQQTAIGLGIALPRALAFAVLLVWMAILKQRLRVGGAWSLGVSAVLLSALAVNVVVNFPLAAARFWMFGFILSAMWAFWPPRQFYYRAVLIIIMTVAQFSVFPWYSSVTRGSGEVETGLDAMREYLRFGDFSDFQTTANVVLYVEQAGIMLGRNLLSVVFFMIPRAYWDKAEPLGVATSDFMGYSFTNLSTHIFSEIYVDFGFWLFGVVLVALGFAVRRLDNLYEREIRTGSLTGTLLVVSLIAGYTPILVRGSLLAVIGGIATLVGAVWALGKLSSRVMR